MLQLNVISRKEIGYLFLAIAMIMVGSTVIASKIITFNLPPFTLTALRFAIALPFFLILMKITHSSLPKLDLHDAILIMTQAGLGSLGYTVLIFIGIKYISAASAGILLGILPVVATLLAIIISKEWPALRIWLALAICIIGIIAIHLPTQQINIVLSIDSLIGSGLIFLAVICESIFILLNKRLRINISPISLSTLMAGISLILTIIPACLEHHAEWRNIPWSTFYGVLYYALVPTVLGFILWYEGTMRVKSSEAALFTALLPLSAIVFAKYILHESITILQLLGCGCILLAIILVITLKA